MTNLIKITDYKGYGVHYNLNSRKFDVSLPDGSIDHEYETQDKAEARIEALLKAKRPKLGTAVHILTIGYGENVAYGQVVSLVSDAREIWIKRNGQREKLDADGTRYSTVWWLVNPNNTEVIQAIKIQTDIIKAANAKITELKKGLTDRVTYPLLEAMCQESANE